MTRTKSSATLALGFGDRRLPYLYSGSMNEACPSIAQKGFDAVELLVPSPDYLSPATIMKNLTEHGLRLSAIGTGGAYITGKLHLCSRNDSIREAARQYIREIVDLASPLGAVVILGLVTGFMEPEATRAEAFDWLVPSLNKLGIYASERGVGIVIEPLNRYESNLINRLDDGLNLISMLETKSVKLLADLFHMNIEEPSIDQAILQAGSLIGHVHFVDSNRCAPGMGHTNFASAVKAIEETGYSGYVSIEALPEPDSDTAANQAISAYKRWFDKKQPERQTKEDSL